MKFAASRSSPTWLIALAFVLGLGTQCAVSATFDVEDTPGFEPVLPALQAYLRIQQPLPRGTQHFCVVGYDADGQKTAWVYWREGQRLIHWEPAAAGFEPSITLLRSRRDLDLRRDVVRTEREVGSSSFRIDRPWLDRLLADCRDRGKHYRVGRYPRPR